MDSSRIGERDNVPHVLNYPFYSALLPLQSATLALTLPALTTSSPVAVALGESKTLNKACPIQFRVSRASGRKG